MKLAVLALALMAPLAFAGVEQKKKSPAAPPPAKETVIPKEAKQIEPYTYRYTDAQGKIWIYRKTPFGVARFPEPPPEAKPVEEIPEGMTAVEDGDSIRFERPTPFGKHRWTRKKSELTELERRVWERERPKSAAAKSNPQE
ncbi:MAG: hypothetical protein NTZ98_23055 [Acidobacteria bacterium]|nr:hypothetical protein [Acidobacteriota bacterium]